MLKIAQYRPPRVRTASGSGVPPLFARALSRPRRGDGSADASLRAAERLHRLRVTLLLSLLVPFALLVTLAVAHAGSSWEKAPLTQQAMPEQTVLLEEDRLAVTVAAASQEKSDPLDSEFSIWVGQVEVAGRAAIWVELIDSYGEVIYDSEIGPNETHLLPDGRAIVVRALDPATRIAKLDESRLPVEGTMVVTRRVVEEGPIGAASVEFMETKEASSRPAEERSPLEHLAAFGNSLWQAVAAFMTGAATKVQIAWNWLMDTLQA